MTDLGETDIAILRMAAGGMNRAEIAFALDISQADLEYAVATIFAKLNISDTNAAIISAAASGLLKTDL